MPRKQTGRSVSSKVHRAATDHARPSPLPVREDTEGEFPSIDAPSLSASPSTALFTHDLAAQLEGGAQLILYGPRGSGKSTLLRRLEQRFQRIGTLHGTSPSTHALAHIVDALASVHPDVDWSTRRAANARLLFEADRRAPGVLLLDHTTAMTNAMKGYLKRLRGGVAGVLLVTDVDSARERACMRAWRAGVSTIAMPLETHNSILRLLLARLADRAPPLEHHATLELVRAARGRVGWLVECLRRLREPDYWSDNVLRLAALRTDVEMQLRGERAGPRAAPRAAFRQS